MKNRYIAPTFFLIYLVTTYGCSNAIDDFNHVPGQVQGIFVEFSMIPKNNSQTDFRPQLKVFWSSQNDANSYTLYYRTKDVDWRAVKTSDTSIVFQPDLSAPLYEIKISASNKKGEGEASSVFSAIYTPELQGTAGNRKTTIDWRIDSEWDFNQIVFDLHYHLEGLQDFELAGTNIKPGFEHTNLANDITLTYYLSATIYGQKQDSIAIKITPVDLACENPKLTSTSFSIDENQSTVSALSTNAAAILSVSSSVGVDRDLFTMNGDQLIIRPGFLPDYENPSDKGDRNNVYEIGIDLIDNNGGKSTCLVDVTVRNIHDSPPSGLTAKPRSNQLNIRWNPYIDWAEGAGNNSYIQLYRKNDGILIPVGTRLDPTTSEINIRIDFDQHISDQEYLIHACQGENDCIPSNPILVSKSTINKTISYIKASNRTSSFSRYMALSGNGLVLAVGAPMEAGNALGASCAGVTIDTAPVNGIPDCQEGNTKAESGAVYVYRYDDLQSSWSPPDYIKASNPDIWDNFGSTVVLNEDGTIMAIAAPSEAGNAQGVDCSGDFTDTNPNNGIPDCQEINSKTNSGAVYVYHYNKTSQNWSNPFYLKGARSSIHFGDSLALKSNGSVLAVGGETDVHIFRYETTQNTWVGPTNILPSNITPTFGMEIALSKDGLVLAVGSPHENGGATGITCTGNTEDTNPANGIPDCQEDVSVPESGAVYVYRYNTENSTWNSPAYIKAMFPFEYYSFGRYISLNSDGSVLAVGAGFSLNYIIGIKKTVHVYRFSQSTSSWSEPTQVDGQYAPTWTGQVSLNADGTRLFISGYQLSNYDTLTATWSFPIYIADPPGRASLLGNNYGWSHAINADGSRLAIGAEEEFGNALGVSCTGNNVDTNPQNGIPDCQEDKGSTPSGAVYVY